VWTFVPQGKGLEEGRGGERRGYSGYERRWEWTGYVIN